MTSQRNRSHLGISLPTINREEIKNICKEQKVSDISEVLENGVSMFIYQIIKKIKKVHKQRSNLVDEIRAKQHSDKTDLLV